MHGRQSRPGVQTADERDEEAKKRAVDVDAADEPEAKRPARKRGKKRGK